MWFLLLAGGAAVYYFSTKGPPDEGPYYKAYSAQVENFITAFNAGQMSREQFVAALQGVSASAQNDTTSKNMTQEDLDHLNRYITSLTVS